MFDKIKDNKIKVLQKIIDKQNEELIELRSYARKIEHYKREEEKMKKAYESYCALSKELEMYRDEYTKLNQELSSVIASYKREMKKFTNEMI